MRALVKAYFYYKSAECVYSCNFARREIVCVITTEGYKISKKL